MTEENQKKLRRKMSDLNLLGEQILTDEWTREANDVLNLIEKAIDGINARVYGEGCLWFPFCYDRFGEKYLNGFVDELDKKAVKISYFVSNDLHIAYDICPECGGPHDFISLRIAHEFRGNAAYGRCPVWDKLFRVRWEDKW